jgi:carboxypeptidase C (cathepsin A)
MKFIAALAAAGVAADRPEDLVTSLPGFPTNDTWGFKAYSGILEVPGPVCNYDSLRIHYQFHTSRRDPSKDPVAVWHQGGPGGSSITVGLYGEMGAFIVGEDGNYINPYAWNNVANMLYLESPAGSHNVLSRTPDGFSECIKDGQATDCHFDDVSQGEAYAHTLTVFFKAFPEFAQNDFYLTGESYFGQFGPNIAHFILNNEPFASDIKLKGIAAGNACWGGDETTVQCNGPNSQRNDVELYHGKGLFSTKLYKRIQKSCDFESSLSSTCRSLLNEMHTEVGPHNAYNIYDNCPKTKEFLERTGKDMGWLLEMLRDGLHEPEHTHAKLTEMNGGFKWDCLGDVSGWITQEDTKKALHLDGLTAGRSRLRYTRSGPASITLYPELVKKIRVMIYNGDADACVPYIGNEEWIGELESQGVLKEKAEWAPWYTSNKAAPAGYVTKYSVTDSDKDFSFVTARLAGHMVPTFQPEAGLTLISTFLQGGEDDATEV